MVCSSEGGGGARLPGVCALILSACGLWLGVSPPPSSPALGRVTAGPVCAVPVERARSGVSCLSPAAARALGLLPGDVVPAGIGPPARMDPARQAALQVPVDLNLASEAELIGLPGIGPSLARRIVAARPLHSVEDLSRVPGLGHKRIARLTPRLRISRREPE